MRFSDRTAFGAEPSGWSEALDRARREGRLRHDLTWTNPTRGGFEYDQHLLLTSLADPSLLHYAADPLGLPSARQAVADSYYGPRGIDVAAETVLLTASTSEAYGFLLKLLCNPGDQVLVPTPSYPLFDLLAQLHDVELVPYLLVYHDGWQIDRASLEQRVTSRTRAVVVVNPNNPTGHYAGEADRAVLRRVAEQHGLALIADEVFLDYPVSPREPPVSFAALPWPGLSFVLSGISKVLALPQMKLAWTVVCGPAALRLEALQRLEVIADTFLSVSAPVQTAFPSWMAGETKIQQQILRRVSANLAVLAEVCGVHSPLRWLPVEGGWSAVLRVPALETDTDFTRRLLERRGVAIHPGSFYGFADRGWVVLSLLTPVETFAAALVVIREWFTGK